MPKGEYFKGKKITVMGLGLLGRGVGDALFLAKCGAELVITDLKTEEQLQSSIEQLKEFSNITFHLGGHTLEDFQNRDLIIKAAGVPLDSVFIAEVRKNNIPVRMSADLFAELSSVPIVGITGTRGKSTTTHMIAHILKATGMHVLVGGNVRGVSTLSLLNEIKKDTIAVLELDSWQLQGFGDAHMSPHVAVFTTFLPDHMNYYHNDMEVYFADKAKIFLYQKPEDTFVVGEQVAPFIKEFGYQSKIMAHTITAGSKNIPKGIALKIPGEHNRYNAGLASEAAKALGVEDKVIAEALTTFEGVEGRLQFLREVNGVKIYNDNNATTPDATIAALKAFSTESNVSEKKKHILLIMGGSDKGLDMSKLIEEIQKQCKGVFLLAGAGTERIKNDIPKDLFTSTAQSSEVSVFIDIKDAVRGALTMAQPGDILLFSPAFASFGLFKNEYDRNDQFVAATTNL